MWWGRADVNFLSTRVISNVNVTMSVRTRSVEVLIIDARACCPQPWTVFRVCPVLEFQFVFKHGTRFAISVPLENIRGEQSRMNSSHATHIYLYTLRVHVPLCRQCCPSSTVLVFFDPSPNVCATLNL